MNKPFDISLVHRLADQLETTAQSLKKTVNSPSEMQTHMDRLHSIVGSMETLIGQAQKAGANPVSNRGDIR
ncbi:hypothetical protein PP175_22500 [Aneurinibacillus sp. Ricciae_BoGa-3]|uniref:hypothetical protein n=1 Tax=Aneurinibacillus sp. Ricciae_BoGa-3 TaxID=3022697 RepID=UPI002340EA97|nr:hypothetical protein [Aneurinibacillus sp. Ricciae_BoGa-3]WCK54051.1 hypothetical protein PP175_22500 [Aneurinibacillus sp. Ricciae_BoGa-3]